MAYDSEAIQSRLIRDLEPVVEVELNRHLGVQKNWYPQLQLILSLKTKNYVKMFY